MATPLDVVSKHRMSAWLFFCVIMAGWLALCIGTTIWRAHQRNNPPVAQRYLKDPVTLGDVSFCLTNGWGYFPVNLTGVYASCQAGYIYEVPWSQKQNSTQKLATRPDSLVDQDIYRADISTFQADQAGCNISQSYRTGLLGDVPKNCFKFQVANVPYGQNTSVTMTLAFNSNAFTNSSSRSGPTFSYLPGPQAAAIMFADGLNSDGAFELTFQALNASNAVQLSPSIRQNIKAFPNGNKTSTAANPVSTPFQYGYLPAGFVSSGNSFIQLIVTTSPRGYLLVKEQDPLNVLTLLPAYGGYWPFFVFAFGLFYTAESTMYFRPFLIAWISACLGRRRQQQHRAKRTQSGVPVLTDESNSGPAGGPSSMKDAGKRDQIYDTDPKLPDF
ncbi:hypothetical protein WJX74_004688 [Apatococcus lobatus]|uniref:Transmembrane protein n=1 Tax=Apatococcus lobatus TaxID=904363 RepID=A0AAW1R2N6_9CHLO